MIRRCQEWEIFARFRLADDENEEPGVREGVFYKLGDFMLTKDRKVVEILQVRRDTTFLVQAEAKDKINFVGVTYRYYAPNIYYAEPKFTRKGYWNLKDLPQTKLTIIESWKVGEQKFVKFAQENELERNQQNDDGDNDQENDLMKYCFCRQVDANALESIAI